MEDNIVLKTEGLANPIQEIGSWIESKCITLWCKVYPSHIGQRLNHSKGEEFTAQPDCENVAKRAVLRYFWRELVANGALDASRLPLRFTKWIDMSSADCIFTEQQVRQFSRHHLRQCPWYLEMRNGDPTPADEIIHRANCDATASSSDNGGMLPLFMAPIAAMEALDMTDKNKAKAIEKAAKAVAREAQKEAQRLEKETAKKEKKEIKERNKELAALVAKEGPEKLISQLGGLGSLSAPAAVVHAMGISPSASSRPSTFIVKPSQTVYSIPTGQHVESAVGVKVMCNSPLTIMPLCDSVVEEGDDPAVLTEMRDFLKEYGGTRLRRIEGEECALGLADMVLFDVPEDLPVPAIDGGKVVPDWNKLPTRMSEGGRKESQWIYRAFEMAATLLRDGAPLIVFYPDSKFISNELQAWAHWAEFEEETKWFAINGLPLSRAGHPGRTLKLFMVKCFVRKVESAIPFSFFDRMELQREGIQLSSDGFLTNLITQESLTMKGDSNMPWRGAREKSTNFLEALIDLCTQEDDVILDITASTG